METVRSRMRGPQPPGIAWMAPAQTRIASAESTPSTSTAPGLWRTPFPAH